ncbi:hypothetical protein GF415_02190 [Candidatus Micrarchaeota archaeon]|nr:hypothetical protein [Candidatus Micrarchaeota archaeon]
MPEELQEKITNYEHITGMSKLARRYFVMNTFDGTLTIFGVLLGSFLAGITSPGTIVTLGLGAGAAIFISGVWGTYLSESAERTKARRDLEQKMLKSLEKTKISEADKFATCYVSLINGLSPLFAILVILIPFFSSSAGFLDMGLAYYFSFLIWLLIFVFLGVFLGKLSKENIAISAMKTFMVGVVCAITIYLISAITGSSPGA